VIAGLTVTEVPQMLRLTRQEESVFKALMARAECTKVQLLEAAWPTKVGMADEPDIKIVDVFVHKLRKKLGPHGIAILTRFGHGYSMPPESKAAVARLLEAAVAAERKRAGG
jgi:DNA-binding response OmpR family regulator